MGLNVWWSPDMVPPDIPTSHSSANGTSYTIGWRMMAMCYIMSDNALAHHKFIDMWQLQPVARYDAFIAWWWILRGVREIDIPLQEYYYNNLRCCIEFKLSCTSMYLLIKRKQKYTLRYHIKCPLSKNTKKWIYIDKPLRYTLYTDWEFSSLYALASNCTFQIKAKSNHYTPKSNYKLAQQYRISALHLLRPNEVSLYFHRSQ